MHNKVSFGKISIWYLICIKFSYVCFQRLKQERDCTLHPCHPIHIGQSKPIVYQLFRPLGFKDTQKAHDSQSL